MCTRFYVNQSTELIPYTDAVKGLSLTARMCTVLQKDFKDHGEIRPTDMTTVIAPDKDGRQTAFPMVWGYHIEGIKRPVVNARVESAKDKTSFSSDWQKHRCVIPASYYFEWEHIRRPDGKIKIGQKYAIHPKDSSVTWLAGLYRIEEERGFYYPVFTVLTKRPTDELARIHNRMPVILPPNAVKDWIRPDSNPEKMIRVSLTDMTIEKTT